MELLHFSYKSPPLKILTLLGAWSLFTFKLAVLNLSEGLEQTWTGLDHSKPWVFTLVNFLYLCKTNWYAYTFTKFYQSKTAPNQIMAIFVTPCEKIRKTLSVIQRFEFWSLAGLHYECPASVPYQSNFYSPTHITQTHAHTVTHTCTHAQREKQTKKTWKEQWY